MSEKGTHQIKKKKSGTRSGRKRKKAKKALSAAEVEGRNLSARSGGGCLPGGRREKIGLGEKICSSKGRNWRRNLLKWDAGV